MKRFFCQLFDWSTFPVWMIIISVIVGLIPLFMINNIDLFFVCIGTGISAAVVQCSITQNRIQKDNIKLQLFDKRYQVYKVVLDSKTLLKRNNWGRYVLLKGNDISSQMIDIEEKLYNATQLSALLFNYTVTQKMLGVNNMFCRVAEKYKQLLIAGNNLLNTQNDKIDFTQILSKYLVSNETADDNKEYNNQLKERFPEVYILLMEYSAFCRDYLDFIEQNNVIRDMAKEIIIKDLDK